MGAVGVASSALLGAPAGDREGPSAALPRAPKDTTSEFVISFWSTGEGLPVNDIQDLKETPDGYLWLGTHHGLVRFDGVRFETFFRTPHGHALRRRGCGRWRSMARAGFGSLRMQVGLVCLEQGTFYRGAHQWRGAARAGGMPCAATAPTASCGWITMAAWAGFRPGTRAGPSGWRGEASAGARWVRDFEGQLCWLAGRPRQPASVCIEDNTTAWHASVGGVPGNSPLVAAPRRAGGLWVARDARLRFVTADGSTRVVADFPWRYQSRVTCMMEDSRGRLWIGTESRGLFCYAAGQFKQVVPTASGISCLLEDGQDNLWAGTRGGGLVRLRQRHFFVHDLRSGLAQ